MAAAVGTQDSEFLALAAAVEANSEHPLAKAIVEEAKRKALLQLRATNFQALAGRGAQASVDGKVVPVGAHA